MKIYERQLAVFAEARALEYEDRIVRFLRDKFPTAEVGEALPTEVRARIAEAYAFGLGTERQIAAYVLCAWRFGDAFISRLEPMRNRLASALVSPDDKAQMLLEQFDALAQLQSVRGVHSG